MQRESFPKTELTFGIGWVDMARTQAQKYREDLNNLNAFPVPDRDTGSNIFNTLQALYLAFNEELLPVQNDLAPQSSAERNRRLGQVYEKSVMRASRSARGNSGTLLCTWALEAVRTYWQLPGHLTEGMSEQEVARIPVFARLNEQHAAIAEEARGPQSAYWEAFTLAAAAERVRQSLPEPALMESTMGSIMLALADYRFHYRAGGELEDLLERIEFRKNIMLRALTHTAENPPAPQLRGITDAGALGFYLTVVHTNPRWRTSRLDTDRLKHMLNSRREPQRQNRRQHRQQQTSVPTWELMGTVCADAVAAVQMRSELEQLGDSLLITPLDTAAGLWNLHVHVSDIAAAREVITRYGEISDERVSSLAEAGVQECTE